MELLIADMVQTDPTKRPIIDEVVTRFSGVRGNTVRGSFDRG